MGWLDETALYLEPVAAFHAVQQLGSSSGTRLTASAPTLWKRMNEAALLASTELESRETRLARKTFAGARRNTLHLRQDVLAPQAPPSYDDDCRGKLSNFSVAANDSLEESKNMPSDKAPHQDSQPLLPPTPGAGRIGQVGRVVHPAPGGQFETGVHCGSRLPEERRYVCAPCGEAFQGNAA